jgi:GntR family transcriptional regulator
MDRAEGTSAMISKTHLHLQAREHILALINELSPGGQLPGEAALSKMLGVSRTTIRDALTHLERDGLVIRRHGIGTFVAPKGKQLGTVLNEVRPIPEVISASGYKPGMKNVDVTLQHAPAEAYEKLQIAPTQPLQAVRILFLANAHPAIYITYYLAPILQLKNVDWHQFDGSMVTLVERFLNTRIHQSHARISAVPAPEEVATQLNLETKSPVLRFVTVAYLIDGRPCYYSVSHQDSNLLEVSVVRSRREIQSAPPSVINT